MERNLNSSACWVPVLLVLSLAAPLVSPVMAEDPPAFILTWESSFSHPRGVCCDASGNVYVADGSNHRIKKFDGNGNPILSWGGYGTGDGKLYYPYGVCCDASGNVYVTEWGNDRVQKFDENGAFLAKWGSNGSGDGQFSNPEAIACDASGDVYVADTHNYRVQKFDGNGTFITKWGAYGTGNGQFRYVYGIECSPDGHVYVSDQYNRIQKFDNTGTFVTKWGSVGSGDGQFIGPHGVCCDTAGNVYVADTSNHRVQKFDENGTFLTKWGSQGSGDGQFSGPSDIAIDAAGSVFVSDEHNRRIHKYGSAVSADASGLCISTVHTCISVPVVFARSDAADARGASVTIELSPELALCGSITQGDWLTGFETVYEVLDHGGGAYTVDQAILGLPCGVTTGGLLFEIPVQKAAGVVADATGTITVTEVLVRDCSNQPLAGDPGLPASIPIDITVPTAVADLGTVQKKTGNGPDGTTEITVSFTVPGDADETFVYRKGFDDYPEYDDGTGAVPTPPATPAAAVTEGWTLTPVTTTGQGDEPSTRDYWYYVVFTEDACDNVSAVSDMTTGTLNYHLGDVTPGGGDNEVDVLDLTALGASYGASLIHNDPVNYLDVGPTADFSVDALPDTDNEVQFEDLMMFAINHGQVSAPEATRVATGVVERPSLVLRTSEGRELTAHLVLRNHESAVKGIHSLVSFDRDALELVSVTKGGLAADAFFATVDDEAGVIVDAAVMGTGLTFTGAGEVAELTFRRKAEGAAPELTLADLRSVTNRSLGDVILADESDPATTIEAPAAATLELLGARPNPFRGSTDIVFVLPDSRQVHVSIYDVGGRLVRTLTDRTLPAGEHRSTWDGRTADGSVAGAGIYFYTFRAGDLQETRKLQHVR